MTRIRLGFSAAFSAAAIALLTCGTASALDQVKIGKGSDVSITFAGMDLGVEQHIWDSVGISPELINFEGDGKMQPALAAKQIDFAIGSGPGLAYHVKGVPAIGVADVAGPPKVLTLAVPYDGSIKTVADLKGQSIGVSSAGSLSDWLAREFVRQQGWGPDGAKVLPLGNSRTRIAMMKTGQLQGNTISINDAYDQEQAHISKVILNFGDIVPQFVTHALYARTDLIKSNPDLVRRFVTGWFKIVAFMKTHREEGIKSTAHTMRASEPAVAAAYDIEMSMLSNDGAFKPDDIQVLIKAIIATGILEQAPDLKELYDDEFVPVKL